jgi:hypothetical protein
LPPVIKTDATRFVPDRLTELKRQRALIAEHLVWLDHEIGALQGVPTEDTHPRLIAPPQASVSAPPLATPTAPAPPSAGEVPDPALNLLQEAERQRGQISKSGCWIVFATFVLIGIGVITTYILFRYR